MNLAEQQGFREWVSLGLAERPDQTLSTLVKIYSPEKVRGARQIIALARALGELDEEGPEPEPEVPGKSCGWCGRSNPPSGLRDLTIDGSQEEYECRDSGECDRARIARQEGRPPPREFTTVAEAAENGDWRSVPPAMLKAARQPAAHHQQLARTLRGFRGSGWSGHQLMTDAERAESRREVGEFEHERGLDRPYWRKMGYKPPAWLSSACEAADHLLLGLSIAAQETRGWLALQHEVDERTDELVALTRGSNGATASPPLTERFSAERANWGHTIRGGALNGHTISGQRTLVAPAALPDSTGTSHPHGWEDQDHRRGGQDPRSRKPRSRRHYFI
jgi:hypothetical protein